MKKVLFCTITTQPLLKQDTADQCIHCCQWNELKKAHDLKYTQAYKVSLELVEPQNYIPKTSFEEKERRKEKPIFQYKR